MKTFIFDQQDEGFSYHSPSPTVFWFLSSLRTGLHKPSTSTPMPVVSASLPVQIGITHHSHSLPGNLFIFPVCRVHFVSVIGLGLALRRLGTHYIHFSQLKGGWERVRKYILRKCIWQVNQQQTNILICLSTSIQRQFSQHQNDSSMSNVFVY